MNKLGYLVNKFIQAFIILLNHSLWVLIFFLFITPLLYVYATTPSSNSEFNSKSSIESPTPVLLAKNTFSTKDKETMIHWSRQLGVTCIYCHNLDNFKDNSKLTFKTSLKHHQMVRVLQEEIFSERDKGNALKVKVDCYMCHRGKGVPDYVEPPGQLTK